MTCTNCGNVQDGGKFCGKCGTAMNAADLQNPTANLVTAQAADQAAATSASPVQPNEYIEKAKHTSKNYWNYLKMHAKSPSRALSEGNEDVKNGLISLILYSILLSATLYFFVQSFSRSLFGGWGASLMDEYAGPTFFSVFGGTFMYTVICLALVTVSLFAINKVFGPGHSYKQIISMFGAHMLPSLALGIVSFIFIMMQAYMYGNVILVASLLFTVFVLPLYLIGSLLTRRSQVIDPIYGFVAYIILFAIVFAIYTGLLADSTVGSYLDELL